ncbi:MAG: hypothetical protein WD055_06310 [Candidatus Dependentiae bacterium]
MKNKITILLFFVVMVRMSSLYALTNVLEFTETEKEQYAIELNEKEVKADLILAYLQKLTQLQARQTGLNVVVIAVNTAILLGMYLTLSEVKLLTRKLIAKGCL